MKRARRPAIHHRTARAQPRTVLVWALLVILSALGLYAVGPWILPVRIYEGPMVQMSSPDAVTLVWFLTRPAECHVDVSAGSEKQRLSAVGTGERHEVRITGLQPGAQYSYDIYTSFDRRLTDHPTFRTSRPPGERVAFIVFGDSGRGSRAQYRLAESMGAVQPPPDFLLHTGDVVYPAGERRHYEPRFFAPYRHLISHVNFWPCLGNHDVDETGAAEPYTSVFTLPANGPPGAPPEHNYWFEHGSCRVAVIDSNAPEDVLRDQIAPWLRDVMSDSGPRWRIVSLHHPPYTGGKYQPDERVQRALVPIFEETGVDVVFSGHDHNYQRLHPLRGGEVVEPGVGVLYVVTGAGGARLYDAKGPRPSYVAAADHLHHSFTHVVVDGAKLELHQVGVDGLVFDEFTLQKSATAGETPAPATAPTTSAPASAPASATRYGAAGCGGSAGFIASVWVSSRHAASVCSPGTA